MGLPTWQSEIQEFQLLQSRWSTLLSPFIDNISNKRSILKNVSLSSGANVVNHLLGKKLSGWNIIRKRAAANIYDTQDSNQMPTLTLLLVSDADTVVDIEVF